MKLGRHNPLRLLSEFDQPWDTPNNLCDLLYSAWFGVLKAAVMVALGVIIGFALVVAPAIELAALLLYGYFEFTPLTAVYLIVYGLAAVKAALYFTRGRDTYVVERFPRLREAYRAWKDKYCPLVEYER